MQLTMALVSKSMFSLSDEGAYSLLLSTNNLTDLHLPYSFWTCNCNVVAAKVSLLTIIRSSFTSSLTMVAAAASVHVVAAFAHNDNCFYFFNNIGSSCFNRVCG